MNDPNAHSSLRSTSVSSDCFPITPNDNSDLPATVRAIRAQTGGVVQVVTAAGNTRDMQFFDGETRNIIVTRVMAAGTTASGLEGMT